jgi:uncharacterized YceG family protein
VIERERRRREREARRKGGRAKKAERKAKKAAGGGITGSFGSIGRKKKSRPRTGERPAAAPQTPAPDAAPAPETASRPTAPRAEQSPAAPPPEAAPPTEQAPAASARADRGPRRGAGAGQGARDRATAGRDALRARMGRAGGADRPLRPGNYKRRRIAALVLALAGILLVWFLVALFQPFAGDGEGSGSVTVEIPEGAGASEIAKVLDDAGVVSSARLFEWRLQLAGKAGEIQADSYVLAEGMSYGAAMDALTSAPTGEVTVSIGEGYDRQQIADLVLPEGVSSDEYLKQTETAPSYFDPVQYGAKAGSTLEGFLFPATYPVEAGAPAVPSLIKQQLRAFQDNIAKVDMAYAKKKNLTVYDVLIIASMVDKEALVKGEEDDIAAVIYNRLSKGEVLGIDATTRFETKNYDEPITQEQLDADTPYNTRTNQGLTPTPIGNPGLAAIKAAANPAKVNYLYFVVKPGTCGEHTFTASEAEFEKLVAEYQAALEAEGGSPTEC